MMTIFLWLMMPLFNTASIIPNNQPFFTPENQAILLIEEVNLARTHPALYAKKLRLLKQNYHGYYLQQEEHVFLTEEGVAAVEEAIAFLENTPPLAPLLGVPELAWAARDHVRDQGRTGGVGHRGSDHSHLLHRVSRYGRWHGSVGENIRYGRNDAQTTVMHWIINDGMTSRSHRRNLFETTYHVTGSACGTHPDYGQMCVMLFAEHFTANEIILNSQ
ncbi:CAP domain-containing protein [Thioflexithrix psekupsensis]|uniref:SCP domain-containing protein n=1 Tax=Thioflexithrix psekupsensis TaxID=1570016 RepID=A0A251XC63_9GAMM|nr:CAP domain-containing protein [Thioflexithrix psekupsensis]OUD16219.1 hypothetical protein TPSD3_00385 [Thioflexithrix psekupsensis]